MKTLLSRLTEESKNYDSKVEHALDHLEMAQAIMFEEFEGRDVNGIYSEFETLHKLIEHYNTNTNE